MIDCPAGELIGAIGPFKIPRLCHMDAEPEMLRHTSAFASSFIVPDTSDSPRSISVWAAPDGIIGKQLESFATRSEEHTSELQSLMRISYAVICLKKKKKTHNQ